MIDTADDIRQTLHRLQKRDGWMFKKIRTQTPQKKKMGLQ